MVILRKTRYFRRQMHVKFHDGIKLGLQWQDEQVCIQQQLIVELTVNITFSEKKKKRFGTKAGKNAGEMHAVKSPFSMKSLQFPLNFK